MSKNIIDYEVSDESYARQQKIGKHHVNILDLDE